MEVLAYRGTITRILGGPFVALQFFGHFVAPRINSDNPSIDSTKYRPPYLKARSKKALNLLKRSWISTPFVGAQRISEGLHRMPQLRLALAQQQFWVGDIQGNVRRIISSCQYARDALMADLIVFPELCLLGYPPDDLILRAGLPDAVNEAVLTLVREVRGITAVVGVPEFADEGVYNSALVIREGVLLARYRKQILPNYGVFDEKRHFLTGHDPVVFDQGSVKVGVCICEDLWSPRPISLAKAAGAHLILGINASPFEIGKQMQRRRMLFDRAKETGLPIVYVNCVGGQDDLVFDGDSSAVDGDGRLVFRAASFDEGIHLLRLSDGQLIGDVAPRERGIATVYRALVHATRDYVNRNGFPGVLVGLSGGIDSAVVAAIAADALGSAQVWGVSLPSRYTADMSNEDAQIQADRLGIRYTVLPIEPAVDTVTGTLATLFAGRPGDITEENIQSRLRGLLLMALSNKFGDLLLATSNKSEMAVGYSTLYGDMCGGFAPIKDAYKTLVYRLARYRNTISPVIPPRVIARPPTAELRADQKDSDQLPDYGLLDSILDAYVEKGHSIPQIASKGFDLDEVRRVTELVRRSEYKRRQAPPGPKITRCAFGRERRYPLTAVYGEL